MHPAFSVQHAVIKVLLEEGADANVSFYNETALDSVLSVLKGALAKGPPYDSEMCEKNEVVERHVRGTMIFLPTLCRQLRFWYHIELLLVKDVE